MWTVEYQPIVEALVDIGALEDFPSDTLPGSRRNVSQAWLPGPGRAPLQRRRARRLPAAPATQAPGRAHIMEHVSLELQSMAGFEGGFGRAREISRRGVYKVVDQRASDASVGRRAIEASRDLVLAAISDEAFDVPAVVAELREMAEARCLGPSTSAHRRCRPRTGASRRSASTTATWCNSVTARRSARIWTAETDGTSAIAEGISRGQAA
jgi:cyanophycin synthetase